VQDNKPDTPDATKVEPASLRDRGLAWLVDAIIRAPLAYLVFAVAAGSKNLVLALLLLTIREAYKPIMEAVYGYTIGKKVLNIKVVSAEDYSPITWNQSLLRFIPWAIAFYTEVFVTIRLYQSPGFAEVVDLQTYTEFQSNSPLADNFLVGMLGVAWVFSCMWIFSDPLRRALHDYLGRTLVVADKRQGSEVSD
jgi:uncharacterized RDD family membrane protein YckC